MMPSDLISLLRPGSHQPVVIGTLGPPGTSSEVAAKRYIAQVTGPDGPRVDIRMYDTYEGAGEALQAGEVSHIVVANAYKAVFQFYMDPTLELAGVFVMDTPLYGIATRRGAGPAPDVPVISTHPSPEPIIAQLLPERHESFKVIHEDSTSAAARAVVDGSADLALTTLPAAQLHGLEFISRTRSICMVWSVFGAAAVRTHKNKNKKESTPCYS
ncbi:hypothetical protein OG912_39750 (plasmid) [Streptomyces sp. NBC_00464]|uniref:prephenate dehydratase domain-containing protein n=1 Tax=unclassified Streptomyces TaxID=2593676 RepID=UPI002DDB514E|nr:MULTISPECIES: prephenate dehydratase domain-containing protein [unclassified Streptomyces]WRZ87470.1 hypothetical protein OG316_45035 [Streptomyces sp. NBC_01022]